MKTVTLKIRVTTEMLKRLKAQAKKNEWTVSALVRDYVLHYLRLAEAGNQG